MIDPKDQADELVTNMYNQQTTQPCSWQQAKQCALVAVHEILKSIDWHDFETPNKQIHFWLQVKTEIELL